MYGIMRIEKRKRAAVYGLQIEATRTKKDHDEKGRDFARSDINWNLTDQNFFLVRSENWGSEITRQIKAAGVRERSDSVVLLDGVYTASADYFKDKDMHEIKAYFEDCLSYHIQTYCQGDPSRVISAVIHMDETTPHLQVASVPLYKDDIGMHLSAKKLMGGRDDYRARQDRFFDEVSSAYGLDRGEKVEYEEKEKGGRLILSRAEDAKKHVSKRQWQIAELENTTTVAQEQYALMLSELEELQFAHQRSKDKLDVIHEEISQAETELATTKSILSAAKVDKIDRKRARSTLLDKDKVILPRADYDALVKTAHAAEDALRQLKELQADHYSIIWQAEKKAEHLIEQAKETVKKYESDYIEIQNNRIKAEAYDRLAEMPEVAQYLDSVTISRDIKSFDIER